MNENINEIRNYGSSPFQPGDIDVDMLRSTLRQKRKVDLLLLTQINLKESDINTLNEDQALRAFNGLMTSTLYAQVDGDFLKLRPEIRRLLTMSQQSHTQQETVNPDIVRTLNRALLHAIYSDETMKSRRYNRFSVPEMSSMRIQVTPLAPEGRESYEGKLLNISMGGMALLLPKKLPELTHWLLRLSLGDHTEVETLVQIRHSVPKQSEFVHGFQFVSIPNFLGEHVERVARDNASCEERIRINVSRVCETGCSLFDHCVKPQKVKAA